MRLLPQIRLLKRIGIIGASLAVAVLMAGCTAVRFGYNQGPELAYWWMDRQFGFGEVQSPIVRQGLTEWFAWHRSTQLPSYANQLAELRQELKADTSAVRMCAWFDRMQAHGEAAIERALPWLGQAAREAGPSQITHLRRQHAKRTAEFKNEYLQGDARARLEASTERAVERFERLYGRLGDAQKAVIAREVQTSPFDAQAWLAERDRRHQVLLSALEEVRSAALSEADTQQALRRVVEANRRSSDAAYREYQARLVPYNCAFAAKVHNATTPAQREAAVQRIKGWEEDFRALARQAPAPMASGLLAPTSVSIRTTASAVAK